MRALYLLLAPGTARGTRGRQVLVASLDYETSLQGVADLLVPDLAECCFVDVLEAEGMIVRIAAATAEAFARSVADGTGLRIDPAGDHPVAGASST